VIETIILYSLRVCVCVCVHKSRGRKKNKKHEAEEQEQQTKCVQEICLVVIVFALSRS
jgi:hypothetical protein